MLAKLREEIPGLVLRTSLIVGFPGETKEDFDATCEFLSKLRLLDMHVFPYSRRAGTRAAEMDGQIPEEEKHRRSEALISIGKKIREEILSSAAENEMSVLFEREKDGVFEGFSREYIPVRRKGDYRCGEVYTVKPE